MPISCPVSHFRCKCQRCCRPIGRFWYFNLFVWRLSLGGWGGRNSATFVPAAWTGRIAVGIATRYGLDGPGIESLLELDFVKPSRQAMESTQPPAQWVPGVKRPGRGVNHPLVSGIWQRKLCLCFLSRPSSPVLGRTLAFTFFVPSAFTSRINILEDQRFTQ